MRRWLLSLLSDFFWVRESSSLPVSFKQLAPLMHLKSNFVYKSLHFCVFQAHCLRETPLASFMRHMPPSQRNPPVLCCVRPWVSVHVRMYTCAHAHTHVRTCTRASLFQNVILFGGQEPCLLGVWVFPAHNIFSGSQFLLMLMRLTEAEGFFTFSWVS